MNLPEFYLLGGEKKYQTFDAQISHSAPSVTRCASTAVGSGEWVAGEPTAVGNDGGNCRAECIEIRLQKKHGLQRALSPPRPFSRSRSGSGSGSLGGGKKGGSHYGYINAN